MKESVTNIDYWERVLKNPRRSYKELFRKEKKLLTKTIRPRSKVLDVGCGDGRTINDILGIPSEIVGIDFDKTVIKKVQEEFSEKDKVKILFGSAFEIPLKDRTFDYVLLMMTLVNFSGNKLKALSEMKRVMKKTGSIILSVYSNNAFNERSKMYGQIEVPIAKIEGTKFIFDKSVGANESEQFSFEELEALCNEAGLSIIKHIETKIGLICEIKIFRTS